MDINRFLEELDRLFEEKNINDVEPFFAHKHGQGYRRRRQVSPVYYFK